MSGRLGRLRLSGPRRLAAALRASSLRIDPARAGELVADGALLVDVRRHDDPAGFLEGAVRISPDELPARLGELRRDVPIVLACT